MLNALLRLQLAVCLRDGILYVFGSHVSLETQNGKVAASAKVGNQFVGVEGECRIFGYEQVVG